MRPSLADALQVLLDKREIEELVVRYCRAADRRDWRGMALLYHDDATDDHGNLFQGSAADYLAWLPTMTSKMRITSHHVSNHFIVVRGEQAEGEVYVVSFHLKADKDGNDVQVTTGGRYLDRYERRAGVWKFARRKAVMDWNEVQPSLQRWPVEGAALDADPAWEYFAFLGKD